MLRSHLRNNVIGYVALFIALGGTAVAAAPHIRSGDPAGGDLSGTYPNPTIRAGAVTPPKFGTLPAARVQATGNQTAPAPG